jgi:hypothetical protein
MDEIICPEQPCPCGGVLGFYRGEATGNYYPWHRPVGAGRSTKYSLNPARFAESGGYASARDTLARYVNAWHGGTAARGSTVYGSNLIQTETTIPRDTIPRTPPLSRQSGGATYADECACGGLLGYDYDAPGNIYRFWHQRREADGLAGLDERWTPNDYLVRRGRTPLTQLMAFAENRHAEERGREEKEKMLAARRDPQDWPSLQGKRVVVTGTLARYDRKGVDRAIADAGGYACDKVTRDVDLLAIGTRPGAVKRRDAATYGIPTLDEPGFIALLDRSLALRRRERDGAAVARPVLVAPAPVVTPTTSTDRPLAARDRARAVAIDPNLDAILPAPVEGARSVAPRARSAAKRSPTADELLAREGYLRDERD